MAGLARGLRRPRARLAGRRVCPETRKLLPWPRLKFPEPNRHRRPAAESEHDRDLAWKIKARLCPGLSEAQAESLRLIVASDLPTPVKFEIYTCRSRRHVCPAAYQWAATVPGSARRGGQPRRSPGPPRYCLGRESVAARRRTASDRPPVQPGRPNIWSHESVPPGPHAGSRKWKSQEV